MKWMVNYMSLCVCVEWGKREGGRRRGGVRELNPNPESGLVPR